jgi:N-acetylglucosamine-6-phosphate deacetylase
MRLEVDAAVVDGDLLPGDVEVVDGEVTAVALPPAGTGRIAAPGFVDLQVNGFAGVDLLTTDEDGVCAAAAALQANGVTAWQPTLITSDEADTVAAAATVGRAARRGVGATIVGLHLEGPFLAPERLGTHPGVHRRDPDPALLERLLASGPVTSVTIAPELPGAMALVDRLVARGIVVAAGHSDASAEQAHAAFDRGVRTVTHLFNAMHRFTPRDPGIAGAALARPDVVVQAIVDRLHLADDTVRMIANAAAGRLALVTDAIAAAGLGPGRCRLGEVEVTVDGDGAARRGDGTLAGSVLTMPTAVRNLVDLGVPFAAAVQAATAVPARVLGRDDLGVLRPGARADVLVLDEAVTLHRVLQAGREVAPV